MVSQVSEQLSGDLGRRIQPTYGYYRQPDGRVKYSTVTRLEKLRYQEDGWEPLDQYGVFDASPYTQAHPLEGLFMFGGAHELSVEQIIEEGFYMNPPMVPTCKQHLTQFHRGHTRACWVGAQPVEFPQMEGVETHPSKCDFCERTLPTPPAKEQHQSVAHKERLGNLQTGASLGISLAGALNNGGGRQEAGPSYEDLLKRVGDLETMLLVPEEPAEEPVAETSKK